MGRIKLKPTGLTRAATGKKCGLCGSTGKLYRTECCGNWICDDEHKYEMFSHATNSCSRNHRRYTVCASHRAEDHEGDWQTCKECRDEGFSNLEMYVWAATNEFNFVKLQNPPEYEPTLCSKCKRRISLGSDGYSVKGGEYFCYSCSPVVQWA